MIPVHVIGGRRGLNPLIINANPTLRHIRRVARVTLETQKCIEARYMTVSWIICWYSSTKV